MKIVTLLLLPIIASGASMTTIDTYASPEVFEPVAVVVESEREARDNRTDEARRNGSYRGEPIPNPSPRPIVINPQPSATGTGTNTTDNNGVYRIMPYAGTDSNAINNTTGNNTNNGTAYNNRTNYNNGTAYNGTTNNTRINNGTVTRDRSTSPIDTTNPSNPANPVRPRVRRNRDNYPITDTTDPRYRTGTDGTTLNGTNGNGMTGNQDISRNLNNNIDTGRIAYDRNNMTNPNMLRSRTYDNTGTDTSMSRYTDRKDRLNNEFSRMFELKTQLMQDNAERMAMRMEYEALREEYNTRLRSIISDWVVESNF